MFKSGFIKINKKSEKTEVKSPKVSNDRGVVYLGHIPHGFYESEMKSYFTQFGEVTNVNIPKSKKTGRARGFAFIEFEFPEVAKVVAETMNNYLMHKKILVAKYLPSNEVKKNTFWRCNKDQVPLTIKNRSILRKAMERPLDSKKEKKKKVLLNKHVRQLEKKLKSKGIEFDVQIYNPESSVNKVSQETENENDDNLLENCSESDTNKESDVNEITPPKQKKQNNMKKRRKL